jgi:predicted nucleic acid-binding Zn ribbon protein
MEPEPLEAFVRAWAKRIPKRKPKPTTKANSDGPSRVHIDYGPSPWSLTFDTEEEIRAAQALRVITYELRSGDDLEQVGIGYDPEAVSPDEVARITAYAAPRGIRVCTREEFIELLFAVALDARGEVIGQNLSWDLVRLAVDHGPARIRSPMMRGGFSLDLGGPARIEIKAANAGASFIRLVVPKAEQPETRNRRAGGDASKFRGYFLDVGAVGRAMFGGRPSLKWLADSLRTEHRKLDFEAFGGPITDELLTYALNDVRTTWEVSVELRRRYEATALPQTLIHRISSSASLGKAIYREMGLEPWRAVQRDFADRDIAAAMEAYYGGRVETKTRREPVPGVLLDYQAQYATVSVLMDMWPFHIASGIQVTDEPIDRVTTLLEEITVDGVLDRSLWSQLHALVLVAPHDDALPVRADYPRISAGGSHGRTTRLPATRNIGLQRVAAGPPRWITLADAIVSKLVTGHAPPVLEVRRISAGPAQKGLTAIDLAGDERFRVDPYRDDLIKRLVESRDVLRAEAKARRSSGDESGADLIDGIAKAQKAASNSLAYGVPIEINVTTHERRERVRVFRPDGTSYLAMVLRTETPGRWFQPFIATLVVAGGRLLLQAAISLLDQAGGDFVMCDTDGLFVAATPDGQPDVTWPSLLQSDDRPPRLLSWAQVEAVVDRFSSLNPYDRPGSILEVEPENFDPATGERRVIWCFSVAAKRYALVVPDDERHPRIVGQGKDRKRSEHGLAHLLSPLVRPGAPNDGRWVDVWWEYLIGEELGISDGEPDWFDHMAVGQLAVRSRHEEQKFHAYNADRPYRDRVRPWAFLIRAFPARDVRGLPGVPGSLVSAYSRNADDWPDADWFSPGDSMRRLWRARVGNPEAVIPGSVPVQTYGDYYRDFRLHPESKALGPDGQPCHPWTRGVLSPRHVRIVRHRRIGKEANRLNDQDESSVDEGGGPEYPESICHRCGKPVPLGQRWCSDACRKQAEREAVREARHCDMCGRLLAPGQRRWCSDACRKKAERRSGRTSSRSSGGGAVSLDYIPQEVGRIVIDGPRDLDELDDIETTLAVFVLRDE